MANSPLAVIEFDADFRVIRWSGGAERIFRWSSDEMLGRRLSEVRWVHEEAGSSVRELSEEMAAGKKQRNMHANRNYRKDGSIVDCEWYNSAIYDANGELTSVLSQVLDVTEREQALKALREAEEDLRSHAEDLEKVVAERTANLRATIQQLEQYSYSITHDMRAPLRAMSQYSHLLVEDYGSQLPPEGKAYAKSIAAAAVRLDRLITDVLNYDRIVRGELPEESVDLDALVRDIIQQYPALQASGAAIEVHSPLSPVRANFPALAQCVSRLLENALKFTQPGIPPRVKVWTEIHAGVVRLSVEDNGIGIASDQCDRIWGIFQQGHRPGDYGGTGIGLSIVKKAVERMGGRVGVESKIGKGSRFWLELKEAELRKSG